MNLYEVEALIVEATEKYGSSDTMVQYYVNARKELIKEINHKVLEVLKNEK